MLEIHEVKANIGGQARSRRKCLHNASHLNVRDRLPTRCARELRVEDRMAVSANRLRLPGSVGPGEPAGMRELKPDHKAICRAETPAVSLNRFCTQRGNGGSSFVREQ